MRQNSSSKMKFIGITGGVGAGKSTVLDYLCDKPNVRVMMADRIAEELMNPGGACYGELHRIFDDTIFGEDGFILRPSMAAAMFADEKKRLAVNAFVHPAVKTYVKEQQRLEEERGQLEYLFFEAALLIEEHYDEICDELWYIYTSEEIRRDRLKRNRGYSDEKIDQIFASQLTEKVFRERCIRVIDNNGSREDTILQLRELLENKGESTNGEHV